MANLQAELEAALIDSLAGDPWNAQTAGRLAREARSVLLRHRLGNARVTVSYRDGAAVVSIVLPPGPRRVQRLTIRLGAC